MSFAPLPISRVPAATPVAAGTRSSPGAEAPTSLQEWERSLAEPGAIEALYSPQYLRQCSGEKESAEEL